MVTDGIRSVGNRAMMPPLTLRQILPVLCRILLHDAKRSIIYFLKGGFLNHDD